MNRRKFMRRLLLGAAMASMLIGIPSPRLRKWDPTKWKVTFIDLPPEYADSIPESAEVTDCQFDKFGDLGILKIHYLIKT